MEYRIEHDSMGEVKVPADKYWAAQTERSHENFKIGVGIETMPREITHADVYKRQLIDIAKGMAGNGDGSFPGSNRRTDSLDQNRCPKHRSIQHGPDGSVGAFIHFLQVIFLHPVSVGRDSGALYADRVKEYNLRCV